MFVVGDTMNVDPAIYENLIISSEPSNIFCFYDSFSIGITNSSYSKQISSGNAFETPLTYQVKFDIF